MSNQLALATRIATDAHKGQKRKSGEDYINHCIRVMNLVDKYSFCLNEVLVLECKCAAAGHDIIEDTNITSKNLIELGMSSRIVKIIETLTRQKDKTYFDFIMRIADDSQATVVKLCDLEDNMSDLDEGSLKDKYRFAKYILEKS